LSPKDWTIFGKLARNDRCGLTVRFEGPGGTYSGHGPTIRYELVTKSGHQYQPPVTLVNPSNPYHTKNWKQLAMLVDEARFLFDGRL
jgi:hypothetical protein